MQTDILFWLVAGLIALFAATVAVIQFTPNARLRRRRRKSHSRIISKARGPSIKFSVKRPKK